MQIHGLFSTCRNWPAIQQGQVVHKYQRAHSLKCILLFSCLGGRQFVRSCFCLPEKATLFRIRTALPNSEANLYKGVTRVTKTGVQCNLSQEARVCHKGQIIRSSLFDIGRGRQMSTGLAASEVGTLYTEKLKLKFMPFAPNRFVPKRTAHETAGFECIHEPNQKGNGLFLVTRTAKEPRHSHGFIPNTM